MRDADQCDFETTLQAIRRDVDRRLDELVPNGSNAARPLSAAMRHSLLAPGKRLRPVLTILVAEALGGSRTDALDPACAIEMVHCASLILDDLPCMDDASERRGRPANHVEYGQDLAVLASVSLLNRAFGVLAGAAALAPDLKVDLVCGLARLVGHEGLACGQFEDLRLAPAEESLSDLERVAGHKTGALFVASVETGARVAGANGRTLERMRTFAEELGMCFQLLDDVADEDGATAAIGREQARRVAMSRATAAISGLEPLGHDAQRLVRLVEYVQRPIPSMPVESAP